MPLTRMRHEAGVVGSTTAMARHRLTITVSQELYATLQEVAGPRRFSAWLEEAAWERVARLRDAELSGIGLLVDAEDDRSDLGLPSRSRGRGDKPKAARWSALG